MTADDRDLAVRQARDTAALAREVLAESLDLRGRVVLALCTNHGHLNRQGELSCRTCNRRADAVLAVIGPACSWGDDAWHRAVNRLIRLHRSDYRRLLAEEQAKRDA